MNPVVHFDLSAKDRDALGAFYSSLFGWHIEAVPDMEYTAIDTHAGGGINGGITPTEDRGASLSLYVELPDLQAALDRAASLGGSTVMPVMEVPNVVSLAMFADPQGNALGLVKSEPQQQEGGGPSAGANPAVTWFEILGPDPKALCDFYAALFEWKYDESDSGGDFEYYEVMADKGIGGGIGTSPDGKPHSTAYVEVDDLQGYLDKAAGLGATTVFPPMDVGNDISFAQFADPEGIVFGLFRRRS